MKMFSLKYFFPGKYDDESWKMSFFFTGNINYQRFKGQGLADGPAVILAGK